MWSTVSCAEESWTRSEGFSREGGPSFSVRLRCAWADRYALIGDILSTPRPWPETPFGSLFAQSAVAVPAGGSQYVGFDQTCIYEDALVTVNFGARASSDVISEVIEPTVEFLTLDHKRFRWGGKMGDQLLEGEAQGKQIRGHTLSRTLYHLPSVHISFLNLNGMCNETQYVSALLGLTYPAETLLFTPGTISRTIRTDGTDGFTANIRFVYKRLGWNKYWRAKTQQVEEIFDCDPDSPDEPYKSYEPGDFSDWLF